MSVSETRRLQLYETLIDRLGDKPAATLMDFLPPGGWENVATKDDLRLLEERFAGLHDRIDALDSKIDNSLTGLRGEMEAGLGGLQGSIDALDSKIDNSLTGVHSRIDGLDSKIETGLGGVHSRIDGLDSKIETGLTGVHSRIDGLDSKIETRLTGVHSKIDGLDSKIKSGLTGLHGEFALAMARHTRTIVSTMVVIAITIWLALLLPIGAGG